LAFNSDFSTLLTVAVPLLVVMWPVAVPLPKVVAPTFASIGFIPL